MPNPVPLATKEEEDRRAWVTAHHEVVRLIKDCFGDRFSNNEIFDRLKISRRTGYRALGNDERIGKAPGRKPKISDLTIKDMIEYIETGGCTDVGNVWKHLADKFAPDCNPKTVQDAVKKSGFKNYRDTVKLEPLLDASIAEDGQLLHQTVDVVSHDQHQDVQPEHHQSVIDPAFQATPSDPLRAAIEGAPDNHVRWVLQDLCTSIPEAARLVSNYLCPYVAPPSQTLGAMGTSQIHPNLQTSIVSPVMVSAPGKRRRLAVCRRCGKQFNRANNTMDTRECLYHKGSPQKIAPDNVTIELSPESFIWSCCGGNGAVRGCFRAMHTTKKKRTYGKKRDATAAGLECERDCEEDDTESPLRGSMMDDPSHMDDTNMDSAMQDVSAPEMLTQMARLSQISSTIDGDVMGGLDPDRPGDGHLAHELPLQMASG